MELIQIGPAWEQGVNMGPLVSKSHLDSVLTYIQVGKNEGARLLTGGTNLAEEGFSEGHYMTPALFDQVTPEMRIAKEEIFGPVLSVIAVDDEQKAFEAA